MDCKTQIDYCKGDSYLTLSKLRDRLRQTNKKYYSELREIRKKRIKDTIKFNMKYGGLLK